MNDLAPTPSGLDLMRAFVAGISPPPGAVALVGITADAADHGRVVMSLLPDPRHANPMGTLHGGILATLVDSAMACAIQTTLPAGRGCTTLEIKVNYLRPVTEASGRIAAEGRVVQSGRRTAVAEAHVTDAAGRLVATASTTCLIVDVADVAS
jgi:uncharacterized protein (TIGR00369 family)